MDSESLDFPVDRTPTSVKGFETARIGAAFMPGFIIFVHGVNSDGEWFDSAERGLIAGLNTRLGLNGTGAELETATYAPELMPDGRLDRKVDGTNFIPSAGRSPVIRFRWGYQAAGKDGTPGSADERTIYGGRIYLNEHDAWGGGPFQNGTSALNYMWGAGMDDRVFWWIYTNMFPVDGREVYASPPRAYFAHAAHRLKELIKAIRDKQADCPITVVCHSQGNMVTLAAALLGEKEGALADTYVMSNPPYSLESLGMDVMINHDSKAATGQFGGVTTKARQSTFKHFLSLVKARAGQGQDLALINRYHGFKDAKTGELRYELRAFPGDVKAEPQPGIDRDNRGRVFLYCNPHDQVIGVTPVQGIGWRGISAEQLRSIEAEGVLYQRVWAMPGGDQSPPFAVGDAAWTGRAYRYRADNHRPEQFWWPRPPMMRFVLSLNESQGAVSKIFTTLLAPIVYIVTRVLNVPINSDPPMSWAVPITAPVLREPVSPRARRYGEEGDFDEGHDPPTAALAKAEYKEAVTSGEFEDVYSTPGLGDAASERALRYENRARLKRATLAANKQGRELSGEDQRSLLREMMKENPNATDHSTILTNPMHAEKVLAYDVAIGWVDGEKLSRRMCMCCAGLRIGCWWTTH